MKHEGLMSGHRIVNNQMDLYLSFMLICKNERINSAT
ncbi:hypothetical protein Slin_2315 [Spirosoma linguale DSM 74]|uniref:Uncharacterized protein n=1 Tax=Spirosoma linguale (strain ATCC 33905 / DSM 74 / LMG 10896 / Claus 1) TaxID=504472 RepID=D2QFG2_SPILD|nr:hypothetical protein Slin_2315 [Spirosoma linguale DSM 74]